ncbi:MAG TPA: hypothetical protein D7I03_07380, partial [Candidatus Poseidoniales archaeon]
MIDGGIEVSDLVRTLITGFFTSIILLFLVYCFWKLYDRPSKRQIELQEEKREKRKEERMWKNIEAEMAKEQEQAEALATIERKKAEMRARAQPPAAGIMQNALATLDAPTEGEEFLERFKPNVSEIEEILVEEELETEEVDDSDVLLAPELVEVRQDEGSTDIDLLDQLTEDEDEASGEDEQPLVEESSTEESAE